MNDLTAFDREWLAWAVDLAQDRMLSTDGWEDTDWSALEKFKKIARGEQP